MLSVPTNHFDVDLCFLIDCTGSMGDWIIECKNKIYTIIAGVGSNYPEVNIRVACVGYRDVTDKKPLEVFNFTGEVKKFCSFVEGLKATGGGDICEDVLKGLEACTTLEWNKHSLVKIVFHICDAPPHNSLYHNGCSDSYPTARNDHKEILEKLAAMKGMIYAIAKLNNSVDKMIQTFKTAAAMIHLPIIQSELKKPLELFPVVLKILKSAVGAVKISDKSCSRVTEKNHLLLEPSSKFSVSVAIDFGTDGSAFAIALPNEGRIIVYKGQNCGCNNSSDKKIKTSLLLDSNGQVQAFGANAIDIYQWEAREGNTDNEYFERFKMALYDKELRSREENKEESKLQDDYEITDITGKKRRAQDIFTAALKYLKERIMKVLEEYMFNSEEDIKWVLTIPAIWSDKAKKEMREAAIKAGMVNPQRWDQLVFALEPDCASIMARHECKVRAGEKYICLDLGGGTVDIACHQMKDELRCVQIYHSTGDKWGSSYIDIELINQFHELFGDQIMQVFKKECIGDFISLKQLLGTAKEQYKPLSLLPCINIHPLLKFLKKEGVDLIALESKMIRDLGEGCFDSEKGYIEFPDKIWRKCFDKVIDPLVEHLKKLLIEVKQLEDCKKILCVGGFAQSKYLIQRLKEIEQIEQVCTTTDPILAVVEGAARYGLSPCLIEKYTMQYTYGVKSTREWKQSDGEINKLWDPWNDKYLFVNGFDIFIRKGDQVLFNGPPEVRSYCPLIKGVNEIEIEIHKSQKINPESVSKETCCGKGKFQLPFNWWDNDNDYNNKKKEIVVKFFMNPVEKRVVVELNGNQKILDVNWAEDA